MAHEQVGATYPISRPSGGMGTTRRRAGSAARPAVRSAAASFTLARMAKRPNVSAGLLLFRRSGGDLEVFLAHPGGPFWRDRDLGAWTVPKGLLEEGEDPLVAAVREFEEETSVRPEGPFLPLGSVRQKAGKLVHAWAWEGEADPRRVQSNVMRAEWPRGSGRWLAFPEVDRCEWFDPRTARQKINPAQAEFIDRLEAALSRDASG
jgi:predicted NUDIX family NTP pyrophosphohydrolase